MTIPIKINGKTIDCILDSGAQASLIGINFLRAIFDDTWKTLPSYKGPTGGRAVNGGDLAFIDNKLIPVTIGNTEKIIPFCVTHESFDIILGLDALEIFQFTISLKDKEAKIFIDNNHIGNFDMFQPPGYILGINFKTVVLNSFQCKMVPIKLNENCPKTGLVVARAEGKSSSAIVPCVIDLSNQVNHTIKVPFRNTTNNRVTLRQNSQTVVFELLKKDEIIVSSEFMPSVINLNNMPTRFYNEDCEHNTEFYQPFHNPNMPKVNLLEPTEMLFSESDTVLVNNKGLGIPVEPLIETEKLLEESLPKSIPHEFRLKLKTFLISHDKLIAKHPFDAGELSDCKGKMIPIDIPLISKLPYNSKYYKLNETDNNHLNDIVDYLIYHKKAVECGPEEKFGSPAFIVHRGAGKPASHTQGLSPRLVIDTREFNKFLDFPISLQSENIFETLAEITNSSSYITSLDLKQAYFSLYLSKSALESGISNVVLRDRCIRLLVAPTGCSILPVLFRHLILEELMKNDDGERSILGEPGLSFIKIYFDDLLLVTSGSAEEHIKFLFQVLKRLNRMNLRLNIDKSNFLVCLNTEQIDVLGFTIGKGKISPQRSKLDKISSMEAPKTVKQLQKFLGTVIFMHSLLPPSITQLTSHLSELTSSKVKFEWTELHQQSFDNIKQAICSEQTFTNLPPRHQLLTLIYSDSSQTMLGGCIFFLDISNSNDSIGTRDLKHSKHAELRGLEEFGEYQVYLAPKSKIIGEELAECFENFRATICTNLPNNMDFASVMINHINNNLTRITSKFEINQTEIKSILQDISTNKIRCQLIFKYPALVGFVLSLVFKRNTLYCQILNKKLQTYLCNYSYDTRLSPLLLLEQNGHFSVIYLLNDITIMGKYFKNHSAISVAETEDPNLIYKYFLKSVKNKDSKAKVKLQGHFSKTIPKTDRHLPIFQLEGMALVNCLWHFRYEIERSKLTLILTDSRPIFYLFSKTMQESSRRILRFSLKLQMDFPTVKIVPIQGKNNIADFFSRIGIDKQTIFTTGLSPVALDSKVLGNYSDKLLSWSDVRNICDLFPEAVTFSDKKLDVKEKNIFVEKTPSTTTQERLITVNRITNNFNIFDNLINRNTLLKQQREEFSITNLVSNDSKFSLKNEILFFNEKIVLPTKMYGIVLLREHFSTLHGGIKPILLNAELIYHITDASKLKELATELSKRCIVCLAVKSKLSRKLNYGIFPIKPNTKSIMIDFVENLPGNYAILSVVDVFSNYLTIYPMKAKSTQNVINALTNYIGVHGHQDFVVSDNAKLLVSDDLKKFLHDLGSRKIISSPFRSEARSIVEKLQHLLQQALEVLAFPKSEDWRLYASLAVNLLNHKLNDQKITPHGMYFGILSEPDRQLYRKDVQQCSEQHITDSVATKNKIGVEKFREAIDELVRIQNNKKEKLRDKKNKSRVENEYFINDFVYIKNRRHFLGQTSKLRNKFELIPYVIVDKTKGGYYLKNIVSKTIALRHYDELKLIAINSELDSELNLPKEICKILYNLTADDLNSEFGFFFGEKQEKRVTRQMTEEINKLEDLMDDDIDLLYDDFLNKRVSFLT